MKKIFVGVAIVLGLAIATTLSVSASRVSSEITMEASSEVMMAEASSNICSGPKSSGECRCENAYSCRDNTGCQPKGLFERILEMF
ncbi:MAG: hypothetical protein J5498_03120 [Bacteroidales bacterium]|jgi:hypothetical protein|nr:hypothetical protein [Bacteroidales bacterium]MBR5956072.1 hypothetical protein [Bacteroidales bacterium]MEE3406529.1 hypothetical protein [Candidatus Cryptobacteroides sp.]